MAFCPFIKADCRHDCRLFDTDSSCELCMAYEAVLDLREMAKAVRNLTDSLKELSSILTEKKLPDIDILYCHKNSRFKSPD